MAFNPTSDITLDADVANLKTKKVAYVAALAARDAAQITMTQKQVALDAAQTDLVAAADKLGADAVTFKTF